MDFDDIVIGSGLAALGTVLGLLAQPERRIVVLCGPAQPSFLYYDDRRTVPCAFLGEGGLGSHWHGVIPTGWRNNFAAASDESFDALLRRFYPDTDTRGRLGSPYLFVPWRPVRPANELRRLVVRHGARLKLLAQTADDLRFDDRGVAVDTARGVLRATRAWVAAGVLHTPKLLARSVVPQASRGMVSDHAFCYVGQLDGQPRPAITRTREGLFFPAVYDAAATALYTLRPAAFAFRRLDYGIEQRAVFGLPTGNALAKIARRMSPGLLVEAFYNRFGLFGAARTHSVYAQVLVRDAYELDDGSRPLRARTEQIRAATDGARRTQPFAGVRLSQRPEIHLPGIHLHHSLDLPALARAGVNQADSPVQVVDASVLTEIGPDHHSFKMMLSAHERATLAGAIGPRI
ncbi:MAG: hypothetical protein Q8R33_22835 [Burkholderiales bacterium]|nr:hypothetical protein [Burkholderiales bacterium]